MRARFVTFILCILASLAQTVLAQDAQPAAAEGASKTASRPDLTPDDLTPDEHGMLSQEQMRALTRVVAQNYRDNYKKVRDYTFVRDEVEQKLDRSGEVKSTEKRTYEIMALYGEPVERLIEKDGKPLNEKDAAKEEERIQKITAKRRDESDEDRRKRETEIEKQRQKSREFLAEVADAYNFQMLGSETLNGHECWVINGEPRPEYQPKSKDAQILPKFHGRLWIDKAELQLVKMDLEAIDTVSFGWVLARMHKGTRLVYEQTRVNDEVWLPQHFEFKLDMRIALFKNELVQNAGTFRDYRKFRASARIVGQVKESSGKEDSTKHPQEAPPQ